MSIHRGKKESITSGDRKVIYCEGNQDSIDITFLKNMLGAQASNFEFKPLGSCETLLNYAGARLIENGFCLIDRDFRTNEEVQRLENSYPVKFLLAHELEYYFLDANYLRKLPYIKLDIDINQKITEIKMAKKVRFLADFLQFKINNHISRFPRIKKLEHAELPNEVLLPRVLLSKLNDNYETVKQKIEEIKDPFLNRWIIEYEQLDIKLLPSKELFKELKNKIFNQPPSDSDIAKDLASLMLKDNYIPAELKIIFGIL